MEQKHTPGPDHASSSQPYDFAAHLARMTTYGDGPDDYAPDGDDAMRVLNWLIRKAREQGAGMAARDR